MRNSLYSKLISSSDTPNGYISEGATRYYISDHQGNVRQVVDSVGTVLQDNHYYPFGMLMGESSDILEANRTLSALSGNPYRYSGNRLITHANAHLGDFNARWYDFQTLRFLQPDEHREKYYSLNPYLYCAGNPVMNMDKMGKDIWEINKKGMIVRHIVDDKDHTFYIVDNNYNRLKDVEYTVPRSNFIGMEEIMWGHYIQHEVNKDDKTSDYVKSTCTYIGSIKVFKINDDDYGEGLFQFLSDFVTVEFSLFQTSENKKSEDGNVEKVINFITTAYQKGSEDAGSFLIPKIHKGGLNLRTAFHNHPGNRQTASKADEAFAKEIRALFKDKNIKFKIYIKIDEEYIEF